MERRKVLVLKENQVSKIDPQEMERRKVLVLKKNQVLQKKIIQNLLDLQITQSILEKNLQRTLLLTQKKKVLDLRVKKNLKVETVDLKILPLKNIVKKELIPKIF